MIKYFLPAIITLLLTFSPSLKAQQTTADSIKAVINQLFKGMKEKDSTLVSACFSSGAIMQTVASRKDGMNVVRSGAVREFLIAVAADHPEVYDERIRFDGIHIDGDLASVWTPYEFYIGERFWHCGANSFQLARLNGLWKIIYLVDSRHPGPCR